MQSAIDIARWDLKGKALGVPAYELLGGRIWDTIKLYTHADSVKQALQPKDKGYTAFKCGPSVSVLRDIREAIGDELEIGIPLPW